MIGKKQMAKAIMMFGPMPYLNQTMISGPSATFGIMLRLTSTGIISASSGFDQVKASASSTPTTSAKA